MKKIYIAFILLIILFSFMVSGKKTVNAETYTTFESITFENERTTLMDTWGDPMMKVYLKHVSTKRKMFGWNVYYVNRKEPFTYVAETMYHVKNTGSENIVHTFQYEETQEQTVQRSVKGSIECEYSDEEKKNSSTKFKAGLEAELEFEYKQTEKTKTTQSNTVKITIAPMSDLYIRVKGRGYLYNGVARKYFFWVKYKEGGFEYVIITTEYYEIDMEEIEGAEE